MYDLPTKSTFPERLKHGRERAGLLQTELAPRLGVSVHTLRSWEQGTRTPRPNQLPRLAEVLDRTIDWFFGTGDIDDEAAA